MVIFSGHIFSMRVETSLLRSAYKILCVFFWTVSFLYESIHFLQKTGKSKLGKCDYCKQLIQF